jgi:hypothetical protein
MKMWIDVNWIALAQGMNFWPASVIRCLVGSTFSRQSVMHPPSAYCEHALHTGICLPHGWQRDLVKHQAVAWIWRFADCVLCKWKGSVFALHWAVHFRNSVSLSITRTSDLAATGTCLIHIGYKREEVLLIRNAERRGIPLLSLAQKLRQIVMVILQNLSRPRNHYNSK